MVVRNYTEALRIILCGTFSILSDKIPYDFLKKVMLLCLAIKLHIEQIIIM